METVDTYIIRIYRRDKYDPQKIAGLVEIVGKDEKKAFTSRDGLLKILDEGGKEALRSAKKRTRQGAA